MRTGNYPYTLLLLLVVCMMTGCGDRARENSFNEIENRISADPKAAVLFVDSLAADSTWSAGMSKAEHARFDLLRVKSADKAYVRHTSDSLIRTVLGYYEKHTGSEQYPEALYYGGRVYSDLGDSPTALRYFQQALDVLPEKDANIGLRCRILSQTGRLLNSLRLYDKAIPYLEEVISLESRDTVSKNLVYNMELLGAVNFHARNYDTAEKLFIEALQMAESRWPDLVARQKMYLAAVKREEGDYETALSLIRGIPETIKDDYLTTALGCAAEIYLSAGDKDTARIYASRLANLENSNNQKEGFNLLFSPELIDRLPEDSVVPLVRRYRDVVEKFVSKNGDTGALIQNAYYNYSLHERKRAESDRDKLHLQQTISIILCVAVLLLGVLFYMAVRNKNNKIKLHEAISELKTLKGQLLPATLGDGIRNREKVDARPLSTQHLQDKLRREWLDIYHSMEDLPAVSEQILMSDAYKEIVRRLENGKNISPQSPLWGEIGKTVKDCFPDFEHRLRILMGRKPKRDEYRTALLIKCGMTSSQTARLFSVVKSAINYRRKSLVGALFGVEKEVQILDYIIRIL